MKKKSNYTWVYKFVLKHNLKYNSTCKGNTYNPVPCTKRQKSNRKESPEKTLFESSGNCSLFPQAF